LLVLICLKLLLLEAALGRVSNKSVTISQY
jgi:hypothetical protein